MEIVSVINYKGGVGKTTIVANLAAELGYRGRRVLLVDLDPQANLTFSFITVDWWRRRYADRHTIKNWYDAYIDEDQNLSLPSLIINPPRVNSHISSGGCVDLVCSHLALINIDLELATRLGGGTLRQVRNNFLRVHSRLHVGLNELSDEQYDFVLIDCPPNFNVVTKTAIIASDHILVPAIPDYLSTLGIDQLQRHVQQLIQDFNEFVDQTEGNYEPVSPEILGIIPTLIRIYGGEPISTQRQYLAQLRRSGLPVFDTFIRKNDTRYGDAPQYGVPVVLQVVSGQTYVAVREELEDMTTEFLNRITP